MGFLTLVVYLMSYYGMDFCGPCLPILFTYHVAQSHMLFKWPYVSHPFAIFTNECSQLQFQNCLLLFLTTAYRQLAILLQSLQMNAHSFRIAYC